MPGTRCRVLGCTLWTAIPPASKEECAACLNDMRGAIGDVNPAVYDQLHADDVTWLASAVDKCAADGKVAVVMTHHAPTLRRCLPPSERAFHGAVVLGINGTQLIDVSADPPDTTRPGASAGKGSVGSRVRRVFGGGDANETVPAATPLATFSRRSHPQLAAWAYGHTHWNMDEVQGGVRLVANQAGYPYPRDPNLNDDVNPGHVKCDPGMVVTVRADCTVETTRTL